MKIKKFSFLKKIKTGVSNMRALKVGITMLLVIIIGICCGISFLHGYTDKFNDSLKEVSEMYFDGDSAGAKDKIEELKDYLEKYHDILCIILDHADVTETQVSLLRMSVFIESGESGLFSAECEALMSRVDNMYSSEKLNIANVF